MEVVSIQENYFRNSSFKEFSLIEKNCEPRVETPESTSSRKSFKKYRYYINYREQIITKISDDNNFCCYRQWLWLNVVAVSTSWRGSKFWASCRLFWPSCRQSPQLCPLFWMVLEVILDCLALDWAPRVTSCSSWLPRRGNAFYCCHGHYFNCFALFTFFNYLPYV